MKRIFVSRIQQNLLLDEANLHYIRHVLRLRNEDSIVIFDGKQEATGILRNNLIVNVKITKELNESPLKLAIAQIKQARFEWLVEKATEIGVTEIFTLNTKFVNNKINLARAQKIAIEAAKQCGRIGIPKIYEPIELRKFLVDIGQDWVCGDVNAPVESLASTINGIIIGPEGGFHESECKLLSMPKVKLNNNILRSETAGLAGLILINSLRL